LFAKDSPEAVWVSRVLQQPPSGPLNLSYCCHLLRLYGLDSFRHSRFDSGRAVVGVLTDLKLSEAYFGEPIFFRTRSGIRYRDLGIQKTRTGENHRDICLGSFAELGLPLTTPITGLDESFSLHDLLRDSVENFDIKQEELPWTAVAYALYLAPQTTWTNRYGESFDFNALANTLMDAPFHEASCGGAHLLYALTILRRVNSSTTCLSELVRQTLDKYLLEKARDAVLSQQNQGYWSLDWHATAKKESAAPDRVSPRDSLTARLVATGHLLEWLELLPVELQPSSDVYRRAARWLCAMLGSESQITASDRFCPSIHAICAVRTLIGELGE